MAYQSYDGRPGASDSMRKLEAIRLPAKLDGARVLDIGCNEGFFALEAKARGAASVLGVDRSAKAVAAARARAQDQNVEAAFEVADVDEGLPTGPFDYVLFLSALHYVADPAALFRRIHDRLAPDGVLVLECGVANPSGRTLQRALRSIDERFFPSLELLQAVWLRDFSVRAIGSSVGQGGDPIPRFVFHCRRLATSVLLIPGEGGTGKTTLARQIDGSVTLNLDLLFRPKENPKPGVRPAAQVRYDETRAAQGGSIRKAWAILGSDPDIVDYFAETVASAVRLCRGAPLVVVEGHALSTLAAEVERRLGADFRCWSLRPGAAGEAR